MNIDDLIVALMRIRVNMNQSAEVVLNSQDAKALINLNDVAYDTERKLVVLSDHVPTETTDGWLAHLSHLNDNQG